MATRDTDAQSGSARVVAILLAAGRSQRMGVRHKLLMEAGGQPVVPRAAETLLESRVPELIAVLGHDHARVAEALAGLPLRTVVNRDHAFGQMSSVRAGIEAIDGAPAAIVVAPADQPALEPPDIDFLVEAFLALPEPQILVPMYGGQRGNPIVLPGKQRRALLAGGVNFGCRNLIERHPEAVVRIEAPNPHYVYAGGIRYLGRGSFVAPPNGKLRQAGPCRRRLTTIRHNGRSGNRLYPANEATAAPATTPAAAAQISPA